MGTLHLVGTGSQTAKMTALMTTVQALFPVVTLRTARMIAAIAVPAVTTVTAIPLIVDMVMTMTMTTMTMTTMMMTTMMMMTMMMTMMIAKNRSPMTSQVLTRLDAVKSVKRQERQVMICLIANQNVMRSSTLCLPSNMACASLSVWLRLLPKIN